MVDEGDRFDFVHPDYRREFEVIDPKKLKPERMKNLLGGQGGGIVLLKRVGEGTGRGRLAAVMDHNLPGRVGRGEFVKVA